MELLQLRVAFLALVGLAFRNRIFGTLALVFFYSVLLPRELNRGQRSARGPAAAAALPPRAAARSGKGSPRLPASPGRLRRMGSAGGSLSDGEGVALPALAAAAGPTLLPMAAASAASPLNLAPTRSSDDALFHDASSDAGRQEEGEEVATGEAASTSTGAGPSNIGSIGWRPREAPAALEPECGPLAAAVSRMVAEAVAAGSSSAVVAQQQVAAEQAQACKASPQRSPSPAPRPASGAESPAAAPGRSPGSPRAPLLPTPSLEAVLPRSYQLGGDASDRDRHASPAASSPNAAAAGNAVGGAVDAIAAAVKTASPQGPPPLSTSAGEPRSPPLPVETSSSTVAAEVATAAGAASQGSLSPEGGQPMARAASGSSSEGNETGGLLPALRRLFRTGSKGPEDVQQQQDQAAEAVRQAAEPEGKAQARLHQQNEVEEEEGSKELEGEQRQEQQRHEAAQRLVVAPVAAAPEGAIEEEGDEKAGQQQQQQQQQPPAPGQAAQAASTHGKEGQEEEVQKWLGTPAEQGSDNEDEETEKLWHEERRRLRDEVEAQLALQRQELELQAAWQQEREDRGAEWDAQDAAAAAVAAAAGAAAGPSETALASAADKGELSQQQLGVEEVEQRGAVAAYPAGDENEQAAAVDPLPVVRAKHLSTRVLGSLPFEPEDEARQRSRDEWQSEASAADAPPAASPSTETPKLRAHTEEAEPAAPSADAAPAATAVVPKAPAAVEELSPSGASSPAAAPLLTDSVAAALAPADASAAASKAEETPVVPAELLAQAPTAALPPRPPAAASAAATEPPAPPAAAPSPPQRPPLPGPISLADIPAGPAPGDLRSARSINSTSSWNDDDIALAFAGAADPASDPAWSDESPASFAGLRRPGGFGPVFSMGAAGGGGTQAAPRSRSGTAASTRGGTTAAGGTIHEDEREGSGSGGSEGAAAAVATATAAAAVAAPAVVAKEAVVSAAVKGDADSGPLGATTKAAEAQAAPQRRSLSPAPAPTPAAAPAASSHHAQTQTEGLAWREHSQWGADMQLEGLLAPYLHPRVFSGSRAASMLPPRPPDGGVRYSLGPYGAAATSRSAPASTAEGPGSANSGGGGGASGDGETRDASAGDPSPMYAASEPGAFSFGAGGAGWRNAFADPPALNVRAVPMLRRAMHRASSQGSSYSSYSAYSAASSSLVVGTSSRPHLRRPEVSGGHHLSPLPSPLESPLARRLQDRSQSGRPKGLERLNALLAENNRS